MLFYSSELPCLALAIVEEEQLPVSVANFEQRSVQVGGVVADDGEIAISIFVAG